MDPKEVGHRSEYKRCDLPCVVNELLPVGSRSASPCRQRTCLFFWRQRVAALPPTPGKAALPPTPGKAALPPAPGKAALPPCFV